MSKKFFIWWKTLASSEIPDSDCAVFVRISYREDIVQYCTAVAINPAVWEVHVYSAIARRESYVFSWMWNLLCHHTDFLHKNFKRTDCLHCQAGSRKEWDGGIITGLCPLKTWAILSTKSLRWGYVLSFSPRILSSCNSTLQNFLSLWRTVVHSVAHYKQIKSIPEYGWTP